MDENAKMKHLVKLKYKDYAMYKKKMREWQIDEDRVQQYEVSTDFEYKKFSEMLCKEKENKEKRERQRIEEEKKKLEEKERIGREAVQKSNEEFIKKFRNRAMLIDGDNHPECLKGLETLKSKFIVIECWTVTNGLKEKLENQYGIEVGLVEQKPQAVDEIICGKVEKYQKDEKFSIIYIVSHDKRFKKYAKEKKVVIKESIKEVEDDISCNL